MKLSTKQFLPQFFFLVLLLSCAPLQGEGPSGRTRPNILFFLVDDMGSQETSVPFQNERTRLNDRYKTPHMEKLAHEGMKFMQAYACAVCSPSRVSAISGMNVARHQVTNWTLRKNVSPDSATPLFNPPEWNVNGVSVDGRVENTVHITPLPELLRRSGYRTIHCGKAHFAAKGTPASDPRVLGFDINIAGHYAGGPGSYWGEKNYSAAWRTNPPDRIWDVPGLEKYHGTKTYLTEALTLEAIKEVEKAVAEKKPFYLYMSHYAIHAPWEKDDRFYQKYIDQGLKPQEATLASMIEGMDQSLGDLRAALKRLGVEENTIILFMSDNGSPSQCPPNLPLRGHKQSPYEGGVREPMIVRWPGVVKEGSVCRTPIVIEDYFPTILEMAGVDWKGKVVQKIDGVSFMPLLKGEKLAQSKRPFVWHYPHFYSGQKPFSALRYEDWKLIYFPSEKKLELYNLQKDISEKNDLSAQEPEQVKKLAAMLGNLLRERGAKLPIEKKSGKNYPMPDKL